MTPSRSKRKKLRYSECLNPPGLTLTSFHAGLCSLNSFIDDYKRHSDKVAKSARRKKIKGLRAEISHDMSTRGDTGNKTEFSKIK